MYTYIKKTDFLKTTDLIIGTDLAQASLERKQLLKVLVGGQHWPTGGLNSRSKRSVLCSVTVSSGPKRKQYQIGLKIDAYMQYYKLI